MAKQPPAPFSCTYTPNLPEFFLQAGCTLAVSTYQAGKVIFLSAVNDEKLVQLPRNFRSAMALGALGDKLAVAERDKVVVLRSVPGLAAGYPKQQNTYDTMYIPQASYYTGPIDLHGLEWGTQGLWAVNTSFSCLCLIGENFSFYPVWKPSWVSELMPEDRCHLNGMAMKEGKPEFVTAFNRGNSRRSWKEGLPGGGVLIHVETGEVILEDLQMPHTPRLYNGKIYMLLSATGEIICVDPETGENDIVNKVNGFVRGMSKYGDFLFVAYSRLRKNASIFKDLPIADKCKNAGVDVFHLPTGARVGGLWYQSSVDEIFDIQVLPEITRPGILNTESEILSRAIVTPDRAFWLHQEKEEKK
ncbi:MAG: TIGR03032 family protein [Spirochaetia bacterium]